MARAAVIAVGAASLLATASPAFAGWSRPVRLTGPQGLDVLPAQVAISPAGEAAVAYDVQDEDNPAFSAAFTLTGTPGGGFTRPRSLANSLSALALGFDSSGSLDALTGTSPRGMPCCATASLVSVGDRAHPRGSKTTLVRGLTGTTDGQLVPLAGGQLLAAIATQRGVWVSESTAAGRFGPVYRIHFGGELTDLAAAPLARGGGIVAWTSASGGYGAGARRILFTADSGTSPPSAARVAVTVPQGHTIDELALAPGIRGPAVAFVESWTDRRGSAHSVVKVRDLQGGAASARVVSPPFELATDVAIAGDGAGDQVVAFDGCSPAGVCVARAAIRRPGHPFGRPQWLGPIDASQAVAATVTGSGDTLVGWVNSGHVLAARAGVRARRFAPGRTVSQTNYGSDLTLAPGPGRTAFAAWTQGTLAPIVVGAAFRG